MKQSLVDKMVKLLAGILITSMLFFAIVSLSYRNQYQHFVLESNNNYTNRWTESIDSRLNAVYEHLYDLMVTIFNNTSVSSGSQAMDYQTNLKVQDALSAKTMASSDITAIFVLDSENDLYFYNSNSTLSQTTNYNLKIYLKQYCLENNSTLNNRNWDVVGVLQKGYYYKAIKLGKYIVGAISDCTNFQMAAQQGDYSCYIMDGQDLYWCSGWHNMDEYIKTERSDDYFFQGYAISVSQQKYSPARTVFITQPHGMETAQSLAFLFLIIDSGICVALIIVLIVSMNKKVRIPAARLVEANSHLAKGDFEYKLNVDEVDNSEFDQLYGSFNDMSDRIEKLTIETYEDKLKREENRLKMLRAQMRPHTFLNGITTISNLTYTGKPEDIRAYIAAFARFTRYMLNKANDWTTIGDELKNIENYVRMQMIRFPDSIEFSYDCSEEIQQVQIPYLILFSLVENSFKHAMTLVDTMYVSIRAERYEEENFRGVRIIEQDSGPGFSSQALEKLMSPEADDLFTKEHLGLTNVRYSLNLIYRRDDLLRLSNLDQGGARVELLIPDKENENETTGM